MKSKARVVALVVLAGSLALAAKSPPSKPYAMLALAPEDARARANPMEGDPSAVAAGQKLYDRHCAACHGAAGEDGRKGPSLRAPEVQTASAGAVFWVITNGNVRTGMPVWSKLPEPQRWQICSYVKTLGAAAAPLNAPREPGPALGR